MAISDGGSDQGLLKFRSAPDEVSQSSLQISKSWQSKTPPMKFLNVHSW